MATATSTNNSWQELLGNVQQTMADDSHTASQITQYCSRVGVAEIVVSVGAVAAGIGQEAVLAPDMTLVVGAGAPGPAERTRPWKIN